MAFCTEKCMGKKEMVQLGLKMGGGGSGVIITQQRLGWITGLRLHRILEEQERRKRRGRGTVPEVPRTWGPSLRVSSIMK